MGFIGSLFGGDSGNTGGAGMNYQATGPTQTMVNDSWTNSQTALTQQRQFLDQLAAQGGILNQSNVFAQQQALANQLGLMAQGQGPNPAQAQFQQNANQIGAQAAGLIGSQKGMSPALQARLVAQQGAQAGQNAAGQAATLQAQQQIAATQALQNQQNMMANVSGQQVAQQQQGITGYTQGALGQQGNVLGLQGSANAANAGVAGTVANNQGKVFGGVMQGVSGALGMAGGGQVPCYASGGGVGPQSSAGQYFKHFEGAPVQAVGLQAMDWGSSGKIKPPSGISPPGTESLMGGGAGDDPLMPASGLGFGAAPVLPAAHGALIQGEQQANSMKPIPGKAKVSGDSQKNDTQPAMLSPGEIIIPRSIAMHENAPEMAARFVAAIKARNGRGM